MVASEVRKLAERSQAAAGEISTLSISTVNAATEAGEMLDQLVPDIRKTAELIKEISASSSEQKSGVDQINMALTQLQEMMLAFKIDESINNSDTGFVSENSHSKEIGQDKVSETKIIKPVTGVTLTQKNDYEDSDFSDF